MGTHLYYCAPCLSNTHNWFESTWFINHTRIPCLYPTITIDVNPSFTGPPCPCILIRSKQVPSQLHVLHRLPCTICSCWVHKGEVLENGLWNPHRLLEWPYHVANKSVKISPFWIVTNRLSTWSYSIWKKGHNLFFKQLFTFLFAGHDKLQLDIASIKKKRKK